MDDAKIKHLQLIQSVVDRMGRNSFAFKGWAIVSVTGTLALTLKGEYITPIFIALLPTVLFWCLDAYYLRQEKLFRELYDYIRTAGSDEIAKNPFSMNTKPFNRKVPAWWRIFKSKTVAGLYAPMVAVITFAALIKSDC